MFDVIALAIALSMDAFAVSIGLGAKCRESKLSLAFLAAIYFGVFQALMPLAGYFGGKGVLSWVDVYARWIAFFLLLLIGFKMIHDAFQENTENKVTTVTHKALLILSIATSIDAMAAGFTLTLLAVNPFLACVVIGLTTFIFSWFGVFVGSRAGIKLEGKAELFGGVVLVAIGFKFLFV